MQPGDIKYKNLNGDTVIDENDQTAIGDSYLPKLQYSFSLAASYKGSTSSPSSRGGRP